MTAPQNQTVVNPKTPNVKPGCRLKCALECATDSDAWTQEDYLPCEDNPSGTSGDDLTYTWTCSGGTFEGPSQTQVSSVKGQSAKWKAPTTPGRYTISCTIDDKPLPADDPETDETETGDRNDDAITRSCTVVVYSLSLSFVDAEVAAGNVDNDGHKATYAIHASDGQNPVPGVKVPTPTIKSGGLGPDSGVTASCTNDGEGEAETGEDGKATGKMLSGHRTQATVIEIEDEGASASVNQVWNSHPDPWTFDPYFDYDVPSTVTFKMSYSLGAIAGHSMSMENTSISGWELVPASYDFDGDGELDDAYWPETFARDDEDLSGWSAYQGLSEWGNVSDEDSLGTYQVNQTIWWDDYFIVDNVEFDIIDDITYGLQGRIG